MTEKNDPHGVGRLTPRGSNSNKGRHPIALNFQAHRPPSVGREMGCVYGGLQNPPTQWVVGLTGSVVRVCGGIGN